MYTTSAEDVIRFPIKLYSHRGIFVLQSDISRPPLIGKCSLFTPSFYFFFSQHSKYLLIFCAGNDSFNFIGFEVTAFIQNIVIIFVNFLFLRRNFARFARNLRLHGILLPAIRHNKRRFKTSRRKCFQPSGRGVIQRRRDEDKRFSFISKNPCYC